MRFRQAIKTEIALLLTIVIGLGGIVALSRSMDSSRPLVDTVAQEEQLYLTAATANRLSLSFKGLVADWYWMRALQYVGRKVISVTEHVQLDNMGQLDLKLLAPLLDAATTLDPQFMEPYQYAAVVLPAIDVNEAIRIVRKGIAANPSEWRLYHHLGYIHWQQKDFKSATEAYTAGANISGAPAWMHVMTARMQDEGGSRQTAREIYTRMYEDSNDPKVKDMARRRLMQLTAFDQLDVLRRIMMSYQASTGRCPSWADLGGVLRTLKAKVDAAGAPLDPAGTAYVLSKDECDAEIDWRSEVPAR